MMSEAGQRGTRRAEDAVFDDDAVPFQAIDEELGPPVDENDHEAVVDDDEDDDDVVVLSWWQHPVNVVGLVVAIALIGGMPGWLIRDTSSNERGNAADVGFLHDMRAAYPRALESVDTRATSDGVVDDMLERLLTSSDVADRCQVSTKTVLRAIHRGRLRASRLGEQGAYRIREADAESWIEACVLEAAALPRPGPNTMPSFLPQFIKSEMIRK